MRKSHLVKLSSLSKSPYKSLQAVEVSSHGVSFHNRRYGDNRLKEEIILISSVTPRYVQFALYNLNFINFYKVSIYCQAQELLCHCCSVNASSNKRILAGCDILYDRRPHTHFLRLLNNIHVFHANVKINLFLITVKWVALLAIVHATAECLSRKGPWLSSTKSQWRRKDALYTTESCQENFRSCMWVSFRGWREKEKRDRGLFPNNHYHFLRAHYVSGARLAFHICYLTEALQLSRFRIFWPFCRKGIFSLERFIVFPKP